MRYQLEVNGRVRQVAIERTGDAFTLDVDNRACQVTAAFLDAQTLSLLVAPSAADVPGAGQSCAAVAAPEEAAPRHDQLTAPAPIATSSSHEVTITRDPATSDLAVHVDGVAVTVAFSSRRLQRGTDSGHSGSGPQRLVAPMPGRIVRVLVKPGDAVRARQPVAVVEAMKMENEVRAGRDGTVAEVRAQEGASVEAGSLLMVIE